jgi:glucose/arabinose dehydrogenase
LGKVRYSLSHSTGNFRVSSVELTTAKPNRLLMDATRRVSQVDAMKIGHAILAAIGCIAITGCYSLHRSSGAGETKNWAPRTVSASDILVPDGYRVEVVAQNLTFPTGITFDNRGAPCVVESGYCYGEVWTTPRLLRLANNGATHVIATGGRNGPWTGVTFHQGNFYVAEGGELEGGKILKISEQGEVNVLISNLPSMGDHHTDGPVIGPDGKIYFGQGTASNSGVPGEDSAQFGWLKRHPTFHDIPGQDITLTGENFSSKDVLNHHGKVRTGAFVPFGTETQPGQVIKGGVPCSGAVMRMGTDGSGLELVAWGFRNPFGLTFNPDGQLFVTDNGYDDRGSRPVWGTPDFLWRVQEKTWYGWPDYAGGVPLTSKGFKPPHKKRLHFLISNHPNPPPKPTARLGVHASACGLDFARNSFGHGGEAFIALFGDQSPSTGKSEHPVGCKVVRVNVNTGVIEDFAVNRGKFNGPASKFGTAGFERPIAVKFSPDGQSLYVIDFGILHQDKKGAHPQQGTGVVWRITRTGGAQ